jgi:hypothetical protein
MKTLKGVNPLGYYAKDKDNNLFKFKWGSNEEFYIYKDNKAIAVNPDDYEILEIGFFSAES